MRQANPFILPGRQYGAVDIESRLRALESFDLEQCLAAAALPHLQKTVEKKLLSRIRQLEKLPTTEYPYGTTVKLKYYSDDKCIGWAHRDANGALLSAYSRTPLDPDAWIVVNEREGIL
ncbi:MULTISPECIES: hypothetical protein [Pseudomonas]|uniref:hypothetical protein n=1 Tax=Pseudomonas TaxID=286 RepID=UPI0021184E48|nr:MULTISPECIES: hypothetical protein [Pseudomonas]